VRKAFGGRVVLDGVDLVVAPGRITAILGPSGGGKTTLLRLIAGFEAADGGTIAVHGVTVEGAKKSVPPERRRVGYVPQEGALFPHLSVGANVGFGLRRGPERATRVAECLELVDLAGSERARPHELSGGQQQRVALARALAPHPEVVLLDEPFSSLDAGLRSQMRDLLRHVHRQVGVTTLFVTHDQLEAVELADSVALMLGGRIEQHGPPRAFFERPETVAAARFFGAANIVAGRVSGGRFECELGELAVVDAQEGPGHLVARPEVLRLSEGASRNTVQGTVTRADYRGTSIAVIVTVGAVTLHVTAPPSVSVPVGARVGVHIPAHACTVVPAEPDDRHGSGRT
jgi:iron(III) transport system ATP-binding protein